MAKSKHKKAAAKAAKNAKLLSKTKGAKKKAAAAKPKRKAAAPKQSKTVAKEKPAGKKIHESLLKKIEEKVAAGVKAVIDTLTDAEQLHHRLDPGISNEPE